MELVRHTEPMDADELAFLKRREGRDRRGYYQVMKIFMSLSFILPFAMAWFRAFNGEDDPFSYGYYFAGVGFLLCFSSGVMYIGYYSGLRKLRRDIHDRTKTIERTHITRKQFMPRVGRYYFFLDSPNRLSIEVNSSDYNTMDSGDELSIEYTTHSKVYLGYY
jgi:hypothetical protein